MWGDFNKYYKNTVEDKKRLIINVLMYLKFKFWWDENIVISCYILNKQYKF